MTVSERIIKVLKERNMTQAEFAKQVGIATSTISEWKKKKTNPTVEKIMDICNVLQITPEQLLTGKGIEDEEEIAAASPESKFTPGDDIIGKRKNKSISIHSRFHIHADRWIFFGCTEVQNESFL